MFAVNQEVARELDASSDGRAANSIVKLALPKGRMQEGVFRLLSDAGIKVRSSARGYRPHVAFDGIEAKILKPQSVVEMLATGSRDVGFAGADWVRELGADVTELLDTRLDVVRLVVAAPAQFLDDAGRLRAPEGRPLRVATEYATIASHWIEDRRLSARVVRTHGATEVFPPDDADCIIDVAATGDTLREQRLVVCDEIMTSSTRLYASPQAMQHPAKRDIIERFVLLVRSVVEARTRVMVEVNVTPADLERLVRALPCMREPTIATLHGNAGFAVKAAVPRDSLAALVPHIKACGGTDIVVSQLSQIVY
jgi:ATP phosphoribosyltransferase